MAGYLVALAGLAALTLTGRRLTVSWASPAVLLAVGWLAYAAASLLVLPDPGSVVPALLWIVASCGAFLLGSVIAGALPAPPAPAATDGHPSQRYPWLTEIVFVLAGVSIATLVVAARSLGFSPRDLLSISALARIAALSRAVFYFGDVEQSLLARVLLVLTYTGTLFAGVAFRSTVSTSGRVAALIPLFAVLLLGAVYGSRMGILFGGTFWLGGYLAAALVGTGDRPQVGTRMFIVAGGLAVFLLAVLSTAVQFLRYLVGSQKAASLILVDPFGFFAAFAQWFGAEGARFSGFAGGFYMFERIGRMLGGTLPSPPAIDLGFTSSNVYTVFRALIEDFGTMGALMVTAAIGCTGGYALRAVLAGRARWVPILALTYAFVLTSPALSPFAYTGPAVGAAAFLLYAAVVVRDAPAVRQGAT